MDLVPGINIGAGLDALIDQLDEIDNSRAVKRKRVTLDQAQTVQNREELIQWSEDLITGPPLKQKRLLALFHRFIRYHSEGIRPIGGGNMVGKERDKWTLVNRLKDFMTLRVVESQKFDADNKPILYKGKPTYMSSSTLLDLYQMTSLVLDLVSFPAMSRAERIHGSEQLRKHAEALVHKFGLHNPTRRKTVLHPADIRGLIDTIFEFAGENYDLAIQNTVLVLLFFYTGARAGSLVSTLGYPDEYLTWSDIKFHVCYDNNNKFLGFDVAVTLRHFKGYHGFKDLRVTFNIRSTQINRNYILDLGVWLFAHALRHGVLGDRTLDSIIASGVRAFTCDPQFKDQPVLWKRATRSSLDTSKPLNAKTANDILKHAMRRYGIASGQPFEDTFYGCRRGFATNTSKHVDRRFVRFFLGHDANSGVLEQKYDQGAKDLNVTEAVLGHAEQQAMVITPLSFSRVADPALANKVTLKDALCASPEFQHLAHKRALLRRCLATGSSDWMTIEPYKSLARKTALNQAYLVIFIARLSNRLSTIKTKYQASIWADAHERTRLAMEEEQWELVEKRRSEHDEAGASQLVKELVKGLVEREKSLLSTEQSTGEEGQVDGTAPSIDVPSADDDMDEEEEEEQGEDEEDDGTEPDLIVDGEEDSNGISGNPKSTNTDGLQGEEDDANDVEGQVARGEMELQDFMLRSKNARLSTADEAAVNDATQAVLTARNAFPVVESGSGQPQVHSSRTERDAPRGSDGQADIQDNKVQDKISFLRAVIGLVDGSRKSRCQLCAQDPTASKEQKEKVFPPGSKTWDKHVIQFHHPFHAANRWMEHHLQDRRWICPFCNFKRAYVKDTKGQNLARSHVVMSHSDKIDASWIPALKSDTRAEQRKDVSIKLAEQGWSRGEGVGTKKELAETSATISTVPWTFLPQMFENQMLDFSQDMIPSGLFDENGFFRR